MEERLIQLEFVAIKGFLSDRLIGDKNYYLTIHVCFDGLIRQSKPLKYEKLEIPLEFSVSFPFPAPIDVKTPVKIYVVGTEASSKPLHCIGLSCVKEIVAVSVTDVGTLLEHGIVVSQDDSYNIVVSNSQCLSIELLPYGGGSTHASNELLYGSKTEGLVFVRPSIQRLQHKHSMSDLVGEESISLWTDIVLMKQTPEIFEENRENILRSAKDLYKETQYWWTQFSTRYPHVANHRGLYMQSGSGLLRLLATDEVGECRPITSFVPPLRSAVSILSSPQHCARFVSLIPYVPSCNILGPVPAVMGSAAVSNQQLWCSCMAFLVRGGGDVNEHAQLLCSLLLGWGMDAYVAVGTVRVVREGDGTHWIQPYAWVVTVETVSTKKSAASHGKQRRSTQASDAGDVLEYRVQCWDPLTALVAEYPPTATSTATKKGWEYHECLALYRHDALYLNLLPSPVMSVGNTAKHCGDEVVHFDVRDAQQWYPCSVFTQWSRRPAATPWLLRNTIDWFALSVPSNIGVLSEYALYLTPEQRTEWLQHVQIQHNQHHWISDCVDFTVSPVTIDIPLLEGYLESQLRRSIMRWREEEEASSAMEFDGLLSNSLEVR